MVCARGDAGTDSRLLHDCREDLGDRDRHARQRDQRHGRTRSATDAGAAGMVYIAGGHLRAIVMTGRSMMRGTPVDLLFMLRSATLMMGATVQPENVPCSEEQENDCREEGRKSGRARASHLSCTRRSLHACSSTVRSGHQFAGTFPLDAGDIPTTSCYICGSAGSWTGSIFGTSAWMISHATR